MADDQCDLPEAPLCMHAKHHLLSLPACQAPLTRKGKDPPGFSRTSICFVFNVLALLQQIKVRGPGRREHSPPFLYPLSSRRLWKRHSSVEGAHITPPCRSRADIRQSPESYWDASGKHLSLGLQSQTLQDLKMNKLHIVFLLFILYANCPWEDPLLALHGDSRGRLEAWRTACKQFLERRPRPGALQRERK